MFARTILIKCFKHNIKSHINDMIKITNETINKFNIYKLENSILYNITGMHNTDFLEIFSVVVGLINSYNGLINYWCKIKNTYDVDKLNCITKDIIFFNRILNETIIRISESRKTLINYF